MNNASIRWRAEEWQGASFFDLDHTLLRGNSSYHFGAYLFKHGQISLRLLGQLLLFYGLYQLSLLSVVQMQQLIFRSLFKGKSALAMRAWAQAFVAGRIKELLCPFTLSRLMQAQKEGQFTAILSSSPDFLVEVIAHHLRVTAWEATRYHVDHLQQFDQISHFFLGKEKAEWVVVCSQTLDFDKEQLCAYSDSIQDLPFLESVGMAVGVNPDRMLRKICKSRQWLILEE